MKAIIEKIVAMIATTYRISKEAWLIFWGINSEDETAEMAEKVAKTVSKGAAYNLADALLTSLSPLTIGFLKWLGWIDWHIAIVMWFMNIAIAYGLVIFSRNVVDDFTLAESIRASVDSIRSNGIVGRIIAILLTVGIVIRFAIWDGPERITIFFHREISGRVQELLVIGFFSAIQAIVWTKFYSLGIDGLVDIWKVIIVG